MTKYLFLSDIDGTLLKGDSGIALRVKEAAKRFVDMGGLLSLCTGRAPVSTAWVARELDIKMPCVLYSGAAIYDFVKNKFIWTCPMKEDVLSNIKKLYDNFQDISIQVYTKDRIYAIRKNEHLLTKGVQEEIESHISSIRDIQGDILKLVLVTKDVPLLKKCGEEIFGSEDFHFAFASRHFAEVVSSKAGKEKALYKMASDYNVMIENTFSAGDGMTDFPMLQASGFSFAPEDAAESILEICDMIIPLAKEGGMEIAFNFAVKAMSK